QFLFEADRTTTAERIREAALFSLLTHVGLVIFLLLAPRFLSGGGHPVIKPVKPPPVQRLTYLELAPDDQQVLVAPKNAPVSDKNRLAQEGRAGLVAPQLPSPPPGRAVPTP